MSSYTRQQLEGWLKGIVLNSDDRVLDIGGSQKPITGRIHSDIKNEIPVGNYQIMDLEQPHETDKKPDIIWDINYDYPEDSALEPFDVVFCLEVMEYVWNPVQALHNINRFLKKGGTLYLSTAFIYPVHNPSEQDYLRYTREGIKKILKETGFEIDAIQPRKMQNPDYWAAFVSVEGMRPSRDVVHQTVGELIVAKKV